MDAIVRWPLAGVLALALAPGGCKPEAPGGGDPAEYEGGDFQFTTLAVDDGCLDGALEVLFMPDGPGTPRLWDYPTYLPSFGEMPMTYDIDLRDPFLGITVTVEEAGDDRMVVEDAVMEAVRLGEERYGDCDVTMTAAVDLTVVAAGRVEGSIAIAVSDPRGSEGRCPVFEDDPCTMTLTVEAELP